MAPQAAPHVQVPSGDTAGIGCRGREGAAWRGAGGGTSLRMLEPLPAAVLPAEGRGGGPLSGDWAPWSLGSGRPAGVPWVSPGCRGEPRPAAGHGDPGRVLPWHQSLTPERVGFAFEAEQMAPNGTRFQRDVPKEERAGLSHAPSTFPADPRLELPVIFGLGGGEGGR